MKCTTRITLKCTACSGIKCPPPQLTSASMVGADLWNGRKRFDNVTLW